MRLTDDYLYITNKESNIAKLTENLKKCAGKYSFKLNEAKINTNVDVDNLSKDTKFS